MVTTAAPPISSRPPLDSAALDAVATDPEINRVLARLRGRIRLYVFLEGIGLLLVFLGVAFWLSMGIDRLIELPTPARQVGLVLVGVGSLVLLMRYILQRFLVPLQDRAMAAILERRFRQKFGDSLLTVVELIRRQQAGDGPDGLAPYDRQMFEITHRRAVQEAREVKVGDVFNAGPLGRALLFSLLLVVSIGVFAAAAPRDLNIWYQRWLLLSDKPWPRAVYLTVREPEGLSEQNGSYKVARDSEVKLVVRATLNTEEFPDATYPELVRIYHRSGDRLVRNMTSLGEAKSQVPFRDYEFTFPPLREPTSFDIRGGDGALRNLTIEVVPRPSINKWLMEITYPEYTGRLPETTEPTSTMPLTRGSQVVLTARSEKTLVSADVYYSFDEGPNQPAQMTPVFLDRGTFQEFRMRFRVDGNRRILFKLKDTDGIENQEPDVLSIVSVADTPPTVALQPVGVSGIVTARARIPFEGQVEDDHGLDRVFVTPQAERPGTAGPLRLPALEVVPVPDIMSEVPGQSQDLPVDLSWVRPGLDETLLKVSLNKEDNAFEVRDLGLKPGDKLSLQVNAQDRYELEIGSEVEGPNLTGSAVFSFKIVTENELRASLEARELSLRQQFEAIIRETEENQADLAERFSTDDLGDRFEIQPQGKESLEEAQRRTLLQARKLQAERSLQTGKKNQAETLGMAQSFEAIIAELTNNRIDNSELRGRLAEDVAQPLRLIGEELFAELEQRLEALKVELASGDPESRGVKLASRLAEEQLTEILAAMQAVLKRMERLETFNEMLAMLREMIEDHEKIIQLTEREKFEAGKRTLETLRGLEGLEEEDEPRPNESEPSDSNNSDSNNSDSNNNQSN